jgi:hypothetical protein
MLVTVLEKQLEDSILRKMDNKHRFPTLPLSLMVCYQTFEGIKVTRAIRHAYLRRAAQYFFGSVGACKKGQIDFQWNAEN